MISPSPARSSGGNVLADTNSTSRGPADVVQDGDGAIPLLHRSPWTTAEVEHLRRMFADRRSVVSMMAALQRSEQAIRQMASKLGLTLNRPRADYRAAYMAQAGGMSWPRVRCVYGLSKGRVRWWTVRYGGGLEWPPRVECEAAK